MKFALRIWLSMMLAAILIEAGSGVLFCLNAPSDAVFLGGLLSTPWLVFAGAWLFNRIWRDSL